MTSPQTPASIPSTEVSDRPRRRTFTADFKRRILAEAVVAAKQPGAVAALLRREGLYHSTLLEWRKALAKGDLAGATLRRGPAPQLVDVRDDRIADLERENRTLEARARRAEAMLDLQKKVALLLEIATGGMSGGLS